MWAKLSYSSTATIENLLGDIEKVITMTANNETATKASLLACNNVNTSIIATEAGGWTATTGIDSFDIFDKSADSALNIGTVTDCIYVPFLSAYFACGTLGIAKSTDGKVWTIVDSTSNLYGLVHNGSVLVAIRSSGSTTSSRYSSNGITWSNTTTQFSMPSVNQRTCAKSSTIYVPTGTTSTTIYSSTDGNNYTSRTVPSGTYYAAETNDTLVVMIGASIAATSSNDVNWTQSTGLPAGTYRAIAWTGTYFVAVGDSGICARSATGLSGSWTQITGLNAGANYHTICYVGTKLVACSSALMAVSTDDGATWKEQTIATGQVTLTHNSTDYLTTSSTKSYISNFNKTSKLFKAICEGGTRYKYVHVKFIFSTESLSHLQFTCYDTDTGTNKIYNTDSTALSQRVDLVNGGIIFLSSSNRHLSCKTLLSSGNSWGSSTGAGATLIHEYTQDDDWNTPASSYPTFAVCNSNVITTEWYSPKLKSAVATNVTGVSAIMVIRPTITNTKAALSSSDTTIYPSTDIGLYQTSFTYAVIGGKLYGIKLTTTGIGADGSDEMAIDGQNYFIMVAGSTLTTTRILVPKF